MNKNDLKLLLKLCVFLSYKTDGMIQMRYNIIDEIMPFIVIDKINLKAVSS